MLESGSEQADVAAQVLRAIQVSQFTRAQHSIDCDEQSPAVGAVILRAVRLEGLHLPTQGLREGTHGMLWCGVVCYLLQSKK